MRQNLPLEDHANTGESASSSDADQMAVLRKLMEEEPAIGVELIRKVEKEKIPPSLEKFLADQNHENLRYRNPTDEATTSRARSFELKFLGEVSDPVLTGKEIKGKEDSDITLVLVDNTGCRVVSEPEASAKVVILLLKDSNTNNFSLNDFNNCIIIRENDKSRPHFSRPVFICLKQGTGTLSKVKLGQDSLWTKSCRCRLGAIAVVGSSVAKAWTEPFTVLDGRCKLYGKRHPPSLSDEVWRLESISKNGAYCERLHGESIFRVQHFLFLYYVDPQRLKKILRAPGKKWKVMVDHALECKSDDKKMYLYRTSSECTNGVVFDVVGQLRGVLRDHQYVPLEDVCATEKAEAQMLLASAFKNQKVTTSAIESREDITSFPDENSLLDQFPLLPYVGNAANSFALDAPDDCGHSDSIIENDPEFSYARSLSDIGKSPMYSYSEILSILEDDVLTSSYKANLSETGQIESPPGIVKFMTSRWLSRVRKKVASFGDGQVAKRQRVH